MPVCLRRDNTNRFYPTKMTKKKLRLRRRRMMSRHFQINASFMSDSAWIDIWGVNNWLHGHVTRSSALRKLWELLFLTGLTRRGRNVWRGTSRSEVWQMSTHWTEAFGELVCLLAACCLLLCQASCSSIIEMDVVEI